MSSTPSFHICPYSGLAVPHGTTNREHAIPESIGGGSATCLPVYEPLNSLCGRDVDAPFVNSQPIRFLCATRGVRGKNGKVRWFDEEIMVTVGRHEVPTTVKRRTVNGKSEIKIVPMVRQFEDPGGRGFYEVVGAETLERAMARVEEIDRKRLSRGHPPRNDPMHLVEHVHKLPPTTPTEMDSNDAGRFFAKAALGIAFKQFGAAWVRSPFANALRAVCREEADWEGAPIQGQVLNLEAIRKDGDMPKFSPFKTTEDEHEVGFVPYADGVYLHIFLFGVIGARFRVNYPDTFYGPAGFALDYRARGSITNLNPSVPFPH